MYKYTKEHEPSEMTKMYSQNNAADNDEELSEWCLIGVKFDAT